MNAKTKKNTKAPPAVAKQPTSPQWVRDMQAFFAQHGFYRPEDLQKVVGDPRGQLVEKIDSGLALACHDNSK